MKPTMTLTEANWMALGGIACKAIRTSGTWEIVDGPAPMIGRKFRHARDMRAACGSRRTVRGGVPKWLGN